MAGSQDDVTGTDKVGGPSDRSFGLLLAGAFTVIPIIVWWRQGTPALWSLGLAALLLALSLLRPALLRPLNRLWTIVGVLLSRVTNPLMMGFVFFGVLTPVALVMRIAGKRPLRLGFDPMAETYWNVRQPPGPAPHTMADQF